MAVGLAIYTVVLCTGALLALAIASGSEGLGQALLCCASCETCLLMPLGCFSGVWCCYGFVMLCASGWTSFSKYYVLGMLAQCCFVCVQACTQHACLAMNEKRG